MVGKYGKDVTSRYRLALEKYGKPLNALIDAMEKKGFGSILDKEKDAVKAAAKAAGKDREIKAALSKLNGARSELEKFYNYRPVKVGDVIPVPAGTLHALGPGVEIVEPQIPGPTQSLEDGATYPVRYYFPGYKREGASRELDVARAIEMRPEVVKERLPEIISDEKNVKIERLPGGFEKKGLEVRRITFAKSAELRISPLESFHNLTAVSGDVVVVVKGKKYILPVASAASEMLIIPASSGSFTLRTSKKAQVIDTFTPV